MKKRERIEMLEDRLRLIRHLAEPEPTLYSGTLKDLAYKLRTIREIIEPLQLPPNSA